MSSIDAKQLYEWARIGDSNTLSSSWFDIEHVESENGRTILHAAAENGDPELLQMLFEVSGYITHDLLVDDDGQTSLHVACSHGHTAAALYMLEERELDPNLQDLHGKTALSCAADAMAIDLMDYLREKAEPAFPVCDAALLGHIALLRWRLDHGGDVEETGETSFWGELTPLIAAIQAAPRGDRIASRRRRLAPAAGRRNWIAAASCCRGRRHGDLRAPDRTRRLCERLELTPQLRASSFCDRTQDGRVH